MKKIILAACIAMSCASSFALKSVTPQTSQSATTGIVPIEQAQRVLFFMPQRFWWDNEGRLLICQSQFESGYYLSEKICRDKNGNKNVSRWSNLEDLKLPGFEISGYSFNPVGVNGDYIRLTVFFRKSAQ